LVVEDEPHMMRLLQFNLEKAGYSVVTAENGSKALNILKKEKVDLIITDIMMSGIDGLELCKRIKANPMWKNYPVIMLTAKAQLQDKVEGKKVGADSYITKPFHPKELVTTVKKYFINRR
jgi:DNA-binding response OmpR family regulator